MRISNLVHAVDAHACGEHGRVIELDSQLLNDAGFGMLQASEQVHRAAYREPNAP